jgi:hypothetical protein
MPNPNDLNLNAEVVEGDFDNMPTGMSKILPPPQPGIYTFTMPSAEVLYNAFETIDDAQQGQRLQVVLEDEAALIIKQTGQPYHAKLNNRVRTMNYKDGPVKVNDMGMLLKALGITPEQNNNPGYAKAMLETGSKDFRGQHALSTNCSEKRDRYVDGKQQKGKKGCGQKYAHEGYVPRDGGKAVLNIPKDSDGLYKLQFDCVCGAGLRSWGRLKGFKGLAATA